MADGEFTDHYDVLGIEPTATDAEISKAFRQLARKLHPDKNKGNETWAATQFDRVRKSYDSLKDKKERAKLDQQIAAREQQRAKFAKLNERQKDMKASLEAAEKAAAARVEERRYSEYTQSQSAKIAALREENEQLLRELALERSSTAEKRGASTAGHAGSGIRAEDAEKLDETEVLNFMRIVAERKLAVAGSGTG